MKKKYKIGIIGLGYVGLPLAVEFSKKFPVIGFDINKRRVDEIKDFKDTTLELSDYDLKKVVKNELSEIGLFVSSKINDLQDCNVYIITVPTPIDKNKEPLLIPLEKASQYVGKILKPKDIIIYESTVYPGLTENFCVPILEKFSGLKYNNDFYVGYSPERINPGDKNKTLTNIVKVTSGSTESTAEEVDNLYKEIITAGTHKAPSIKVAEAAKVIENSQRDINIAFVNELAQIFNLLDINTNDVLEAASTKWNFLPFKPGLVGGHCIGVDPYYLSNKALSLGYNPKIILSGRELNDSMGNYVANQTTKIMTENNIDLNSANVLVLGITFKENCPDIRNSKVIDVVRKLEKKINNVDVYDTWANHEEVFDKLKIRLIKSIEGRKYDAIILTVPHNEFKNLNFEELKNKNCIIYDVKGFINEIATHSL